MPVPKIKVEGGTGRQSSAATGKARTANLTKIWDDDDEIARAMDAHENETKFMMVSRQIRELIKQGATGSSPGEVKNEEKIDEPVAAGNGLTVDELKQQFIPKVLVLKRSSRYAHFKNKIMAQTVAEKRQEIEAKYLQLQNILYETDHLRREITKCLEFESEHEDIELVPLGEFLEKAPESLTAVGDAESKLHTQRLNRLTWELEERKQLTNEMKSEELQKESVMADIQARQRQLGQLKPNLTKIMDVAAPVQESFQVNFQRDHEQARLAAHLPEPLHCLHSRARAYALVDVGRLSVSVKGELAPIVTGDEVDRDSGAESEPDEVAGGGRGEPVEDGSDKNDLEKSSTKHRKSKSASGGRSLANLIRPHPLSVVITLPGSDTERKSQVGGNNGRSILFSMEFQYFPKLKLVTTTASLDYDCSKLRLSSTLWDGENILSSLFPGDSGSEEWERGDCRLLLGRLGIPLEAVVSCGRLFKWTQIICGLVQQPGSSTGAGPGGSGLIESDNGRNSDILAFGGLLEKIEGRIGDRIQLLKELEDLSANNLATPPASGSAFLGENGGFLSSWTQIEGLDFEQHKLAGKLLEICPQVAVERWWVFSVVVQPEREIKNWDKPVALKFLAAISPFYPNPPPVFLLDPGSFSADADQSAGAAPSAANHLMNIEKMLNINFWTESYAVGLNKVLATGGTEGKARKGGLFEAIGLMLHCAKILWGNVTLIRPREVRGRERRLPLVKNTDLNCLVFDK